MSFLARIAILQSGFQPETQAWIKRCERVDPMDYLLAIDRLIGRGKAHGWFAAVPDLMVHGSQTLQASLEGLKGDVFRFSQMTFPAGAVSVVPRYGIVAGVENAYVNTGVTLAAVPGLTTESHTLAVYSTSNQPGSWQEIGVSGTGGLKPLMLRVSSGFRGGFWSLNDQVIYGGTHSVGFALGSRTGPSGGFALRDASSTSFNLPVATAFPAGNLTLLKAHPAAAGSPNRLLMSLASGGLTLELAQALFNDFTSFVQEIGIYEDIQPTPEPTGANAFGRDSLFEVVPSTMRVFRQANPPATDATPASAYANYPATDWVTRNEIATTVKRTLPANPFSVLAASPVMAVSDPGHGAEIGETVTYSGVAAFGGLDAAVLNKTHEIVAADANAYNITLPLDAPATATGGGAAVQGSYQRQRSHTAQVTQLRGGRLQIFVWSPRGERATSGGPIISRSLKPNDIFPGIVRQTAPFAGVSCRPAFTTQPRAVGCMLVQTAFLAGYAARNESADPRGWGYLDYAEQYDIDPANVHPWSWFAVNRETVFTVGLTGFAACYDLVWLPRIKLAQNTTFAGRIGFMMDQEHADDRDPDLWERDLIRWGEICHAKGFTASWLGHFMHGEQAKRNGFRPGPTGNAPRIINNPAIDLVNVVTTQLPPDGTDLMTHLQAQVDYLRDANGNVPMDKLLLSCSLGTGQQVVTLDNCEAVGAWQQQYGIQHVHVRRAAQSEGGPITRNANQQLIRYLPNLSEGQPPVGDTPDAQANAWRAAVVSLGGTVSDLRFEQVTAYITALFNIGVWPKLVYLGFLAAENLIAATVDLRWRRFGTLGTSTAAPVFTVDRGLAFDGSNDFYDTGFLPSADHMNVLTPTAIMMGMYQRVTRPGVDGRHIMGCSSVPANPVSIRGSIRFNPMTVNGRPLPALCDNQMTDVIGAVTDWRGSVLAQITGGLYDVFIKGQRILPPTLPAAPADGVSTLPTLSVTLGGQRNSATTASAFRQCDPTLAWIGAPLTDTEALNFHNANDAFLRLFGAQAV